MIVTELKAIQATLKDNYKSLDEADRKMLNALEEAVREVQKSWSGSWLGYHSSVYYRNLAPPPHGAVFDQEWGLMTGLLSSQTSGDWIQYEPDGVVNEIYRIAEIDRANIDQLHERAEEVRTSLLTAINELKSILSACLYQHPNDQFLIDARESISDYSGTDESHFISAMIPKGNYKTRDRRAVSQGTIAPAHVRVLAKIHSILAPYNFSDELSRFTGTLVGHLNRVNNMAGREVERVGKVFIGHGQSELWRELKDFLVDRLNLEFEEYNRVPTAGYSFKERLSYMLETSTFAFLVLTGEDEQLDSSIHPRMNVVHEVGLFQGRLGFEKAIILLEDGCEEFSNIRGLNQIRFQKGNIKSIFEEIRKVLEREGIVQN